MVAQGRYVMFGMLGSAQFWGRLAILSLMRLCVAAVYVRLGSSCAGRRRLICLVGPLGVDEDNNAELRMGLVNVNDDP